MSTASSCLQPGFGRSAGRPELNWDNSLLRGDHRQLAAFRQGAGDDMGIMLDINFHFKTEGFARVADRWRRSI